MLYSTAAGYFSYDELYYIGIRSAEIGVNTIVLAKHQVQCTALETLGYERVDETEGYYIFEQDIDNLQQFNTIHRCLFVI